MYNTIRYPDFWVIGPSENPLESDTANSPIFMVPKFVMTDLPILIFTLPNSREIGSKKSADSAKLFSRFGPLGLECF